MGIDRPDFGKELLKKFGWTEGKGLGKDETGTATSIRPKLKFNNRGLGFKLSDDLTNPWWDTYYNISANNLTVHKSDSGKITIENGDKSVTRKAVTSRSYSNFISAGSQDGNNPMKPKKNNNTMQFQGAQNGSILLNEKLMTKIQKGLSYHKRSGAKAARIKKQDQRANVCMKKLKGVSFASKLISFRTFHKKLSILRDFGRLRSPVKIGTTLSCLKNKSAYSPSKNTGLNSASTNLLENNDLNLPLPDKVKKKKKNKAHKVLPIVTHKQNNKIFNKKLCDTDQNGSEVTPNEDNPTVIRQIGKKKRKRLNKKLKLQEKNDLKKLTNCATVISNLQNGQTGKILSKKIKKFINPLDCNFIRAKSIDTNEGSSLIAKEDISSPVPIADATDKLSHNGTSMNKKRKLRLSVTLEELSPPCKKSKPDDNLLATASKGKRKKNRNKKKNKAKLSTNK